MDSSDSLRFLLTFVFPKAGMPFVMKISSSTTSFSVSGIVLLEPLLGFSFSTWNYNTNSNNM